MVCQAQQRGTKRVGRSGQAFRQLTAELQRGSAQLQRKTHALERSEANARLIVETAHDAYIAADIDGRVTAWNAEAERLFGWSREEAIGLALQDLIIPERFHDGHQQGMKRLIETGVAHILGRRMSLPARAKNGSEIQVELIIGALGEGHERWFSCFLHDVTDRQAQQARIEDALAEKETLLREVYHRVKNNLQVIQSLLSLQRRSLPSGPARAAIEDAVLRVKAMALVHEMLYQSGNLAAVSLPVYTRDLLKQIAEASGADRRKIALHADIQDVSIDLDNAVPFGLLLNELVTNCLKHAFPEDRPGDVQISLVPVAEGTVLTVADNGIGFPEGLSALDGGATMGLKLAGSLAKQLGGSLSVSSVKGTIFTVLMTRL